MSEDGLGKDSGAGDAVVGERGGEDCTKSEAGRRADSSHAVGPSVDDVDGEGPSGQGRQVPDTALRARTFESAQGTYAVMSVPIPKLHFPDVLTPTEKEVAAALVEGKSYKDVAIERDVAPQTVANQAAAVFGKWAYRRGWTFS